MNDENLTHKLTKEENAKGGRARSLAKSLGKRLNCDKKCQIYFDCPFMPVSQEDPKFKKGKKRMCALRTMPYDIQKRVTDLFAGGRGDMVKVLMRLLYDLQNKAKLDGSWKSTQAAVKETREIMDSIYGRVIKQETTGDTSITVRWKNEDDDEEGG